MEPVLNKLLLLIPLTLIILKPAYTEIILADAAFSLRSRNNESALVMDNTWGNGGFEGFLSNVGDLFDRTFFEYDITSYDDTSLATLEFDLIGSPTDVITMWAYSADGISSLSDWSAASNPVLSFSPSPTTVFSYHYSMDITSALQEFNGSHIGFYFSIDSHPYQAFFNMSAPPALINFGEPYVHIPPVPEPRTLSLFGLGLVALTYGFKRRM